MGPRAGAGTTFTRNLTLGVFFQAARTSVKLGKSGLGLKSSVQVLGPSPLSRHKPAIRCI